MYVYLSRNFILFCVECTCISVTDIATIQHEIQELKRKNEVLEEQGNDDNYYNTRSKSL